MVEVAGSRLSGLTASEGAAVNMTGGTVRILSSTFANNKVLSGGGALVISDGTLTMEDCTFSQNTAELTGGAMLVLGGTITMTRGLMDFNSASAGGAISIEALRLFNQPTLLLDGTTLANNSATDGDGGGVYMNVGKLTAKEALLIQNTAVGAGGALSVKMGAATL